MKENVAEDSLQGTSKDPRPDFSEELENESEEVVIEKPKLVSQATILLYAYLGLVIIGSIWGGIFQSENLSRLLCWVVIIPIYLISVYSLSKGDSRGRNLLLVYFIWQSFSYFWIILGNIIGGAPAYNLIAYFALFVSLAGLVTIIMLYRGSSKVWFQTHKKRRKLERKINQAIPISNVESSPQGNLDEKSIYRGPIIFITFINVVLILGAMCFCISAFLGLGMTYVEANYNLYMNGLYISIVTLLILTIGTGVSWVVYQKKEKMGVIIAGLIPVISVICFFVGLTLIG